MAQEGYKARIKLAGSGVSVVNQACSVYSGLIYEITNRDRKVWDRSVAPVIKDAGGTVSASDIEYFNYLTGRVKFVSGYSVSGAITADIDYKPTVTIGYANNAELVENADLLETHNFSTASTDSVATLKPSKRRSANLSFANGTIGGFYDYSDSFKTDFRASNTIILEFKPQYDVDTDITLVEAYLNSDSNNFDIENPNEMEVAFESTYPVEYE